MTGAIPERNPIGDVFTGSIIQIDDSQALTTLVPTDSESVAFGSFVVRYGLRFLGKLHISIVPGLLVLDHGEFMTSEEAWEFILKRSNLFPRSEVVGYKNDGTDDMVMLRTLDMAVAPEVLLYSDETSTKPIAKPTALIAPDLDGISERLLSYLPRYASLADWQAEMKL